MYALKVPEHLYANAENCRTCMRITKEITGGRSQAKKLALARRLPTVRLQPEPIFELDVNLPWIVEMCSAKRLAVVEQQMAVGDVEGGNSERNVLAQLFAQG